MRWYTTAGSDRDVLSTTTMTPSGRTFRLKGSAYEKLVNIFLYMEDKEKRDINIYEARGTRGERRGRGKLEEVERIKYKNKYLPQNLPRRGLPSQQEGCHCHEVQECQN